MNVWCQTVFAQAPRRYGPEQVALGFEIVIHAEGDARTARHEVSAPLRDADGQPTSEAALAVAFDAAVQAAIAQHGGAA